MGTRNLEVVILDGEVRVAQYCQWDGYPGGQGVTALKFLRDEMDRETFIEKIKKSCFVGSEELKSMWASCGSISDDGFVSMEVSDLFKQKFPYLSRDCGSEVFKIIQESEDGIKLKNDINFAEDSLFCEWVYVVDLDKNTFEVYKGFNESPLTETDRFYFLQKNNSKYYPVKIVKSYDLNNLPSDADFTDYFVENEDE